MIKFNWGIGIIIFFALFISLAAIFIVFSFQQHNDLVVRDYYEQGANYDVKMQTDKRSLPFTDSVRVRVQTDGVVLEVSEYILQQTDNVDVWFYYAADKRKDVRVSTRQKSLVLQKEKFSKGRYSVNISWVSNEKEYFLNKNLFIE